MNLAVDLSFQVDSERLKSLETELRQALEDLQLDQQVRIESN